MRLVLCEVVTSAPEFGERALSVGAVGKAIGHAPEFHHGAAGIVQHSKIQVEEPMCGIPGSLGGELRRGRVVLPASRVGAETSAERPPGSIKR